MRRLGPVGAALGVTLLVLTACSGGDDPPPVSGTVVPVPSGSDPADPDEPPSGSDIALSDPVEDSVYPEHGDPGVDALHYDLELDWATRERRLSGTATILLRPTADAPRLRLDLAPTLRPSAVTLDGEDVPFAHRGGDLVVRAPVVADERRELVVSYAGRPEPLPAPSRRGDLATVGLTVTDEGGLWTMQEPFGASTWYPVNDQPADKALYDVVVTTDAPFTGVSNGQLVDRRTSGGRTTTRWHLDSPASSYLTTLAVGDYRHTSGTTSSGLIVDYWVPRGLPRVLPLLEKAPRTVDWIEERLGPYPFMSLGLVVTPADSAMETQTMVTLGTNDYVLSEPVIMHEIAHQWYGDLVSPSDWRDVWLNEGMTMYLQGLYEADRAGVGEEQVLAGYAGACRSSLAADGPAGDYDPRSFGAGNIYFCPALMWDALRRRVGDEEFWTVVRTWLEDNALTSRSREQLYDHWEEATGLELTSFFESWIDGEQMPVSR